MCMDAYMCVYAYIYGCIYVCLCIDPLNTLFPGHRKWHWVTRMHDTGFKNVP